MNGTNDPFREVDAATLPSIHLMATLWGDTRQAERALNSGDTQYARRQYVRTLFAMIEGMVFATKQLAVGAPGETLEPAETAMLQGVTYDLDENGRSVTKTARLSLEREIRFALRMYAKSVGLAYDLDVGGRGWQALIGAKTVRDRLMHPKTPKDLEVSDTELEAAKEAGLWFRQRHSDLQETMVDQIARKHGLTEEQVAEFRLFRKNEIERVVGEQ